MRNRSIAGQRGSLGFASRFEGECKTRCSGGFPRNDARR